MTLPAAFPATPAEMSLDAAIPAFLASLKAPTTLLVAVSGGSDSIGLLSSLHDHLQADTRGHRLLAATVDHQLRRESCDEANWVRAFCAQRNIPHQVLTWTSEKPKTGLPAAAREARYRLLAQAADSLGATAIVTGHTLDDQLETVGMRMARTEGAGAPGLAGMAPATLYERRHWILRPLLSVRRQAIRDALISRNLVWIDDPSNEDRRYERVRVRQSQSSVDLQSLTEAGCLRAERSEAAARWIDANAERIADIVLRIDLAKAIEFPASTSPWGHDSAEAAALSALAAIVGGKSFRPANEALTRLLDQLAEGRNFRMTLSGTLFVRRRSELFLTRERRGLLPLSLPAHSERIWDGRYFFHNLTSEDLQIAPGGEAKIAPEIPGTIAAAMRQNRPQIQTLGTESERRSSAVHGRFHLALIDHILPGFDLPLAQALDRLFDREATPFCPI
ncbi:tRNA lysidine(34) synthetase TilS [Peteryoungia ipomoeae]|uniref:tRNA(Ile)-lysidine synthase n=1 Tax=Peteryoungia ipomoeae TaxID=1210932 RepID=A0A4S8NX38_9HYPH|nr:tRNA lysidine(34) synthetase TilS [Peteryoungia ipomoeae]THV21471.1 tRNA lysidine(34) synthetase TilS [Peteryoungia ipomoeae]